jgi:hypothetical protein
MNADEQRLIQDLFEQLRPLQSTGKDRDADLLIRDLIRQSPDAPYYLVQTAIIQQEALNQADARIRDLEDAVRRGQYNDAPSSSSFLSGASVPRSGGRYQDPSSRPLDQPASPWSSPAQPGAGSGGFLSSALSTAGGVAGGMFLADGIRSLFGGSGLGSTSANAGNQAALERAQQEAQSARDDAAQAKKDLAADDAALDETQDQLDDATDGGSDDDSYDV